MAEGESAFCNCRESDSVNEVPSSPNVSVRAVSLGALFSLGIAVGEPYGVLVLRGSPLAADFSTGAAIVLFFLLSLLVHPLVQVITGAGLRRGELVTMYVMMIVAAAIPSWGFTMNLIPLLGGLTYYATPENDWATLILPHPPDWLILTDHNAIWKLFEGGARGEPVPWGAWVTPLVAWGGFILCIYFVTVCVLVILRKQWLEREKLLFPLAILPMEMSGEEDGRAVPAFFRNRLMWVGFLIPLVINSINALHSYHSIIPRIDLSGSILILRNSVGLNCTPRFEVIGLSYLLSLDVSLGVWFFAFLAHIQTGVQRMLGWNIGPTQPFSDPGPPSVAHLALGALFFLVFFGFWNGRSHIRDVLRKAFRGAPDVDDSGELLSYRTAVIGGGTALLMALAWLVAAGLSPSGALVFLGSTLVIFVGLARIISQTGLAYSRATVAPPIFTVNALGSSLVGPAGLGTLGMCFAWAADVRTLVMASAATGLKLAESARLEHRCLFWAMTIAIFVSLGGSTWAVITLAYKYGGINLAGWQFTGLPSFAGNWIARTINDPTPVQTAHLGLCGAGAALMAALMYVKARFVTFPIHPVGLALGLTHPIYYIWFSVFIAWVIKAVVLKYGGSTLYLRLRPFFLGLTLGAFGSAGLWLLIDFITGMSGNVFTLG